jgi:hypothetical protein
MRVGRQRRREVGDGLAVAFVGPAVDLEAQSGLGPPVLDGLLGVPEACLLVSETFE